MNLIKKIGLLSLTAIFLLGISTASAASKPKIDSISKKTDSSVTLKLIYSKYANKKVDVVVSVRNKDTDKTEEKTYENKKLGGEGKYSLKVGNLLASTKYSFKIKIKKHSGNGDYSSWSESKSAKTKS